MNSKTKGICTKYPFKNITKFEGVIDYNIIREMNHKIQAKISTIQSEICGRHHGLLGIEMKQDTYRIVTDHDFVRPAHTLQASPSPPHTDATELPWWIQHLAVHVYKW